MERASVARKAPTARGLAISEEEPGEPVPRAGLLTVTLFSQVKHDCVRRAGMARGIWLEAWKRSFNNEKT